MAQVGPDEIRLLNDLATFQLDCGRPTAALPLLRLSNKLSPQERHTAYLMAMAYLQLGEKAQSAHYMAVFEGAKADEHTFGSLLLKSLIALREGSVQAAREVFLKAVAKLGRVGFGSQA